MSEDWIERLRAAYQAGYYQTEAADGEQSSFPWQDKTCQDCPFWLNEVCQVRAIVRHATADTCSYFEPTQHEAAKRIMEERMREAWVRILEGRQRLG